MLCLCDFLAMCKTLVGSGLKVVFHFLVVLTPSVVFCFEDKTAVAIEALVQISQIHVGQVFPSSLVDGVKNCSSFLDPPTS